MRSLAIRSNFKVILLLVIMSSVIMIFDSNIVPIYSNISNQPILRINTILFISFVAFFLFINYIVIGYSKQYSMQPNDTPVKGNKTFFWSIVVTQSVLCGMLILISIQLVVIMSYILSVMILLIYVSHLSAIAYLTFLSYQFLNWYRVIHNRVVLLYACAFCLLVVNILVSLIFLTISTSYADPVIKLRSVSQTVSDSSIPLNKLTALAETFDYLSISSFILTWIPTIILLKTYSLRYGRIIYWILVTIPLVYFLIPFLSDELGIFDELRLQYGREFNLIYNIFFSPYRQVGGILFGIVFFITSMKVKRNELRALLMISGIGMMLLFGSSVIHGLIYILSPPFGIFTISFMGLASYLLLIGLFTSSKALARDALVRKELYQLAAEQVSLLRNIGAAEMEKSLIKKIRPIIGKTIITDDNIPQFPIVDEDYKEMVKEVITELKTREKI
jgi:hypothetical protein